jgi:hypothetical protein
LNNYKILASKQINFEEFDKKKNYLNELKNQINAKSKNRIDIEREKQQERNEVYNPFGKSGAGAPIKDEKGNIIVTRKHNYEERPESGQFGINQQQQKVVPQYNFNFKNKKKAESPLKEVEPKRIIKEIDEKQTEHQKRLLEQIEDNKRRREAEKLKKLELDTIEDEKIRQYKYKFIM